MDPQLCTLTALCQGDWLPWVSSTRSTPRLLAPLGAAPSDWTCSRLFPRPGGWKMRPGCLQDLFAPESSAALSHPADALRVAGPLGPPSPRGLHGKPGRPPSCPRAAHDELSLWESSLLRPLPALSQLDCGFLACLSSWSRCRRDVQTGKARPSSLSVDPGAERFWGG